MTLPAPVAGSYFGSAVASAGDVNGDGCVDVIVDSGDGQAYLYLGSATGLSTSPSGDVSGSVSQR